MLEPCRLGAAAASLRPIAAAKTSLWKSRRQTPVRRSSSPFVPRRLAGHAVHAASRPGRPVRRWLAWPHAIWGRSIRPIQRVFIGTLPAIEQVCKRSEPNPAATRPKWPFSRLGAVRTAGSQPKLILCGSPFTSPISRKTPELFCGYAHASASRHILSGRRAFQSRIAPSAVPEWIISMR